MEALLTAVAIVIGLFLIFTGIKQLLHICPPNEVLIFSGRSHKLADGSSRGFRMIFGGRGWRVPLLESVNRMRLNVMEIPLATRAAYSKGGIPLHVDAIANVKVSSDPRRIGNVVERFLGRGQDEIARVARETLEGHLRGVLATLTPEEVNEDRLKFAESLTHEAEEDFAKLGLHLDTLKILHVADDRGYLDSIGREAIANVIKSAEMSESDAKRDAEQAEAEHAARGTVARSNAEGNVARMHNDLRRIRAELEATVKSEEERMLAAAREARAIAEQELQKMRVQLEQVRLEADRVLPAEAERARQEWEARGAAAAIRERGRAVGEAMDMLNAAWANAGENAMSIYLIEEIEKILGAVAEGVSKVHVKNLSMIDGGDGQTLSAYVSAYPAMVAALFEAIAKTTGIDIPKTIARDRNLLSNGQSSLHKPEEGTVPSSPVS